MSKPQTILTVFNNAGNIFDGCPVQLGNRTLYTDARGKLNIDQFAGQRLPFLLVNGIKHRLNHVIRQGDLIVANNATQTLHQEAYEKS